ncbi:MAG TPA: hypothetical protein VLB46_11025 [Pyrinomonadaceae bacterium]|nr:hypothetical protein [Pyrinomonadaceae bacterium]
MHLRRTIIVVVCVLFAVTSATAQTKTRLLTLFPSEPNDGDEITLEVVEITYAGRAIPFDKPFAAGGAWLAAMSLRVKNAGTKPIGFFSIYGGLLQRLDEELGPYDSWQYAIGWSWGNFYNPKRRRPGLKPGETVELTYADVSLLNRVTIEKARNRGGVFSKLQFQRPKVEYVDGTEPEYPVMRFSEEMRTVDAVVLEPHKVVIASYRITINERAGKCELVYDGIRKGTIPLDIPAPCEIVRNHFGEAQSHRYARRTGAFDVILVAGGPVSNARSDELMKSGCGTQIQAISLSPRGVVAGTFATYTLACPTAGFDEKDFAINARPI